MTIATFILILVLAVLGGTVALVLFTEGAERFLDWLCGDKEDKP
jgi:hypothetical protein